MLAELLKLSIEIAVAVVLIGVLLAAQSRLGRSSLRAPAIAGIGLAALLCLSLLLHVSQTASAFNQARKDGVFSDRAAVEHCFQESLTGQPLVAQRAPFFDWVKRQLPRRARYAVVPYIGPPDLWCVTLALLPALPADTPAAVGWEIAAGTIPPDLQARIDRHDPTVRVYAPRYVLAREPRQ